MLTRRRALAGLLGGLLWTWQAWAQPLPPSNLQIGDRMATAHVQSFEGSSAGSLVATSVVSGNAFALFIQWTSATITLNSITCDKSGTITLVNNPTAFPLNGWRGAMAYGVFNGSGTATFTLTFSTAPTWYAAGSEVSGVDTTTPFDASALRDQYNLTTTDSNTSGTQTVSDGAYIAGFGGDPNLNAALSVGTGFTQRLAPSETGRTLVESLIQSGAGSRESTFTNATTFKEFLVGMLALKPAAVDTLFAQALF